MSVYPGMKAIGGFVAMDKIPELMARLQARATSFTCNNCEKHFLTATYGSYFSAYVPIDFDVFGFLSCDEFELHDYFEISGEGAAGNE